MDGAVDGVVVGDGQAVRGNEEAAGVAGGGALVNFPLGIIFVQAEHGGSMAIRYLPGGQLPVQQAQGTDSSPGGGAPLHQPLRHSGGTVLIGEGQGVPHGLKELAPGQLAGEGLGEQADALGKDRRAGGGEISGLVAVSQHPQQHGTPGVGGDGFVRTVGLGGEAGDPALSGGVGDRGTGVGGGGVVGRAGGDGLAGGCLFSTGQADQQHCGVGPGGGTIQGVVPPDNIERGQRVRGAAGLPLQSGSGGDGAHQQDQSAQQGEKAVFHGDTSEFYR